MHKKILVIGYARYDRKKFIGKIQLAIIIPNIFHFYNQYLDTWNTWTHVLYPSNTSIGF